MRAYELTLVVRPSLKEDDRKKLLSTVKGFFSDANFTKENEWGEKPLSYPIKKETSGYYVHLLLETEGELPTDLDKRLLTNDNVLRHLFLRANPKGLPRASGDTRRGEAGKKPEVKVEKVEKKVAEKKAAPAKKTPVKKAPVKSVKKVIKKKK